MSVGLGACVSETTHENVMVNGWDIVQEADIMEYGWVDYSNKSSLPRSGEVRNVDSYSVKTGSVCASYNENMVCTVSVPIYDTRYNYEQKEPVVAKACDQSPVFTEYAASDISRDQTCWGSVGPNQWLEKDAVKHVLRIILSDKDESYTCEVAVDKEMYYRTAEDRSGLRAKVTRKCNIRSLEYPQGEA